MKLLNLILCLKLRAKRHWLAAFILFGPFLLAPVTTFGHCDTMDGPVVAAARSALKTRNVNLVLIWVPKKDEAEVKQAFQQTLIVRRLSRAARELADRYFYETVIRIHRTGEGEPYTGLKPAGTDLSPVIPVADKAIQTGSVELLLKLFPDDSKGEIQKRFNDTIEKKKFIKTDVEAGRKYVGAYIGFIHYLEHLYEHKSEKVVLKHGEGI